jgi:spermidine synthase
MRRYAAGVFLLSLATLLLELLLTRIFDVLLWPNLSFIIISTALVGLGAGGVIDTLWPAARLLAPPRASAAFAVSVWLLPLALNVIPFSMSRVSIEPWTQMAWFLALYLALLLPFLLSGLSLCHLFSSRIEEVHRLYSWDLMGAAAGSALIIPTIRWFGPERLLIAASLAGLAASAALATSRRFRAVAAAAAVALVAAPPALGHWYLHLDLHDDKRNVDTAIKSGRLEFSAWDPVSQISVVDQPPTSGSPADAGKKHIAYDGGTQSSNFYPFDGNLDSLRRDLPARLHYQFWQKGVLLSHYLRRDTGHTALIIGSAGGQETKAALMYGARDIDAVEMVGTVVQLATGRYAGYIGHLFDRPEVHVHVGEGRAFLRATNRQYDVIQVFSNYTSSSAAAGSGALTPMYLQTVEAYREYFGHLAPSGILHVSHHTYPRMVSTAAAAWKATGRSGFRSHVVVVEQEHELSRDGNLPSLLIKMTPWTRDEVADLQRFLDAPADGEPSYRLVENPLDTRDSFLPDAFYQGALPPELVDASAVDLGPVTDDRPAFGFMRRSFGRLEADRAVGLNAPTAAFLNRQMRGGWLPMDSIHLIVPALASILYGVLFLIVPMLWSGVGRQTWRGRGSDLTYFGLLGTCFIGLEVLYIQVFTHLVGYPLYAATVVIATMLVGAGIGSAASGRLVGSDRSHGSTAFAGIGVTGLACWWMYPLATQACIGSSSPVRIAVVVATILPQAFFMGMPFPLGLMHLRSKPRGAIAWAWSINGLCSTVGSVAVVAIALWLGFRSAILVVLGLYTVAGLVFGLLSHREDRLPSSLHINFRGHHARNDELDKISGCATKETATSATTAAG